MARNQKDFTYDNNLSLQASGAVTTSTASTGINVGAGRFDGRAIVDISAITVSGADQLYGVEVQVSPDSGFATTVIVAGALRLGHPTATGLAGASAAGRYEVHFTNEVSGTVYPWVRLYTRVAGTTPSITRSAFAVAEA